MIQMEDAGNDNYLCSEILAVYNPNTAEVHGTEYAVVHTGASKGVSFHLDVFPTGGVVRLRASADSASTNRKFIVSTMALAKTIS